MGMGMGMGGMMGSSSFAQQPQMQQNPLDKGKGREINWESQFDQYAELAAKDATKEDEGKPEEAKEDDELKAKVVDELEE